MESEAGFPEHLKLAERELERARRQESSLRRQLEQAVKTGRFWEDLAGSLQREHFAHALFALRRDLAFLRDLEVTDGAPTQGLRLLQRQLQQQARSSVVNVARDFPARVRECGIRIDSMSRHPHYTFNQGFLRVEIDERNVTARVVPRDGNEIVVGLDLDLVVATLCSERARIFDRKTDAQSFLRSLFTAYAAVLRTEKRSEGDAVPLRRVANRLAKNLNRFAMDEFNVDLSRLVQRGDTLVDGKRLHLNHTRDRRLGMLLNGLESGGYVGFISFKNERKGPE